MNGKILFLLSFSLIGLELYAQNLVPNGGFEEYSECPMFLGELDSKCDFWYGSIVTPGIPMDENPSPDWYHSCGLQEGMVPPDVGLGYQLPLMGDGIAGFIVYRGNNTGYREYIGSTLTQALVPNAQYSVRFNIVCDGNLGNRIAVSQLGYRFTTFPTFNSIDEAANSFAHGSIEQIISDTLEWFEFESVFTADSAYQFVHFGLFYPESSIDTIQIEGSMGINSYYFLDKISVEQISVNTTQNTGNLEFRIFPNPAFNYFEVDSSTELIYHSIEVFDFHGRLVEQFRSTKSKYNIDELKSGVYMVKFRTREGKTISKRLVKL